MLGGRTPAIAVLRADVIDIHAIQATGHQYEGRPEQFRQVVGRRAVCRYQHDAINIAFHQRLDQPMLQIAILAADG
jgi:hypothetical protein